MTVTTLSRDKRGKIIEKFDKAQRDVQRHLDEVHAAVLSACGTEARGESANALLVECDRAAEFYAGHRKRVGELLDRLTEES